MANPFKDWNEVNADEHNRRVAACQRVAGAGINDDPACVERPLLDFANPVDEEIPLHGEILNECKRRGWLAFHGSTAHKAKRTAGEPDFEVFADAGRAFCVEVKSKTGKLTEEQQGVQRWLTKLGHETFVIRSFEEFVAICDLAYERHATRQMDPNAD